MTASSALPKETDSFASSPFPRELAPYPKNIDMSFSSARLDDIELPPALVEAPDLDFRSLFIGGGRYCSSIF